MIKNVKSHHWIPVLFLLQRFRFSVDALTTAPTTTVGNIELVNTHCDYCDSNNCNGWTLRAHPDEKFETKDTDISDSIVTEYPTYSDVYSTGLILLGKRC